MLESEIDVGQEFSNPYESSKCRAELLVRDWSRRTGLSAFLFRPGIVVGDSQEGRIVNFDGLYNFMRLLDGMAGLNGEREFRVVANPAATKNIVPVDYVARLAAQIMDAGVPGTYHITNPRPLRLSALCDTLAEIFAVRGAKLVSEEEFRSPRPNRFESMYQKLASSYAPYLAAEPVFDRTNTDAIARGANMELPEIDAPFFRRLVDYAARGIGARENGLSPPPRPGGSDSSNGISTTSWPGRCTSNCCPTSGDCPRIAGLWWRTFREGRGP